MVKFSHDTNARQEQYGGEEGEEEPAFRVPGSELRLGRRDKRRVNIINGMEVKNEKVLPTELYRQKSMDYPAKGDPYNTPPPL